MCRLPAHFRRQNPLDATAVHPESYPIAEGLLTLCGCTLADIGTDKMKELPTLAEDGL